MGVPLDASKGCRRKHPPRPSTLCRFCFSASCLRSANSPLACCFATALATASGTAGLSRPQTGAHRRPDRGMPINVDRSPFRRLTPHPAQKPDPWATWKSEGPSGQGCTDDVPRYSPFLVRYEPHRSHPIASWPGRPRESRLLPDKFLGNFRFVNGPRRPRYWVQASTSSLDSETSLPGRTPAFFRTRHGMPLFTEAVWRMLWASQRPWSNREVERLEMEPGWAHKNLGTTSVHLRGGKEWPFGL